MDRNKKRLAILSAVLLAMVPWMQISRTVALGMQVSLGALAATVAAGVGIHLVYLAFNTVAVSTLQLGGSDATKGEACSTMLGGLSFVACEPMGC